MQLYVKLDILLQVYGIRADEKRGVTICLTTTVAGTLLGMLIIFGGKTAASLSSLEVREAAKKDGHICTPTPVRHITDFETSCPPCQHMSS